MLDKQTVRGWSKSPFIQTYEVKQPIKRGADGYVYKIEFIKDKTPAVHLLLT